MSKSKRIKTPAQVVPVPQDQAQAAAHIRQIGEHNREIARITAAMNDELALVKERHENAAKPLQEAVQALTAGLQTWCEANRDRLTRGGKTKTGVFTTGEVQWRTRPPSVAVRGVDAVLDSLRRLGLGRFIRNKEEVNKEAILNEPAVVAQVPGLSISSGVEDFVVVPFEAEMSEPAAVA